MGDSVRDCGDCIACCVYPRITSLDKPAFTHCSNLTLNHPPVDGELQYSSGCNNCKIYEDRPSVCSGYKCLWLQGYGDEEDRPDRSLMLIDTTNKIDNAIECKPLSEFAGSSGKGLKAVYTMAQQTQTVALVASFYEMRIEKVIGRPV